VSSRLDWGEQKIGINTRMRMAGANVIERDRDLFRIGTLLETTIGPVGAAGIAPAALFT
jgi:hypothetical protein